MENSVINTILDISKVSIVAILNFFMIDLTNIDSLVKTLIGIVSLIYIVSKVYFFYKDRYKNDSSK